MFEGWDNFYLLVGGAAGSLIGLLFIVSTLMAGREREQALKGASVYMTPIVFHLAVVVTLGGLAMAPGVAPGPVGAIAGVTCAAGLVYCAWVIVEIRKLELGEPPHWSDLWCYGVAPLVGYAGLGVAAVFVGTARPLAAQGLAAGVMILLLIAIRNAWDLVTWMAPRATVQSASSAAPAKDEGPSGDA